MSKIKIAIAGVGNCASSLIQGIHYYRKAAAAAEGDGHVGLMHWDLGGYLPGDLDVVAAFDIDARKVGQPLGKALAAAPNNTKIFFDLNKLPARSPVVQMGQVLDGVSAHMADYPEHQRFVVSKAKPVNVAKVLRATGAEVLINYMPVGSQKATEAYAQAALDAGVALVNCMPVFIVSTKKWSDKFAAAHLPCVGDDIKAQVGATIVHRVLTRLFHDRGVQIDATYQLNTGGNTDFLNMLNRSRLTSKKISKTEAVQSQLDVPLPADQVHIGPSDFVPWQKDNKVCFLRIEGRGFGGVPMNLELRLSVEDSPNSAGVSIDAIRCCRIALDRKIGGALTSVSAYTMKHPPQQFTDDAARQQLEQFIAGGRAR
ncbi:MAG: inositol-3-phosphate synthase [Phycisphaerae bacterium]|nr:inositol-3-phosphate synthase [Phycisphaerae bacterium]